MGGKAHHVLCNGAKLPDPGVEDALTLDYRSDRNPNVRIGLPSFVYQLTHLPPRLLDLLEIAAYVYCADRWTSRGAKEALEYQAWSRAFSFHVKVRDIDFWRQQLVASRLGEMLAFLSGDRSFDFDFQAGHRTPPTSLFDKAGFAFEDLTGSRIMLFSGGLDSLSGAYSVLQTTSSKVCLVSHRSSTQTGQTQDRLIEAVRSAFPKRIQHYKFFCNLTGTRAVEETQRTRMFLYSSIAVAIAASGNAKAISIFENGITSLNFPRRQDLLNARSTRTTHPKTISLMCDFFRSVVGSDFAIETPFFWNTKADVIASLDKNGGGNFISSAVSCSRTFRSIGSATHCGECSQCVDRRFATYAAGLGAIDDDVPYAVNFISQPTSQDEARTTVVDYVRQAHHFSSWNVDHFVMEMLSQLTEVSDYIGAANDEAGNKALADLCRKYGSEVMRALEQMRSKHDRLGDKVVPGSLLSLISEREYLKPPVLRLVEAICSQLQTALPVAFQHNAPKNENDVNDKISAILKSAEARFQREHPAIRFGLATTVPDHSAINEDLLIETKYVRGSTTPSRASEGIAADLTKYGSVHHILFVVYDPERGISEDDTFRQQFEVTGRCTVKIIR